MLAIVTAKDSLCLNSPPPSPAGVIHPQFLAVILSSQISPGYIQIFFFFLFDTFQETRVKVGMQWSLSERKEDLSIT